ncbi:MAG: histidinol-phosphate transaminase, partial [Bacteroidota bacterium]
MKIKKEIDLEQLVRPNVLQMQAYSSARSEFTGRADVFLDANENPYETGLNRYPDPLQKALKNKIASIKGVDPQQIFLGNGSDEAIDLLIRIFCRPGQDHILTLPPTYGMYKVSAALSAVAIKTVPLQSNFQLDVAQILAKANQQSKLLFICSPNNPTGNSIERQAITTLLKNFQGIVVIDEAYIDFSGQTSCTELLAQYNNLVVLQTFSKAWGLAGIRLGMAFANGAIIQLFNKTKPPYNINTLSQQAALKALENHTEIQKQLGETCQERERLSIALKKMPFIQMIYPSDANFLLVKMTQPKIVYRYLLEQKIIVRDRSKVLLCEGCLRFTVGTPKENQQLIQSLQ